MSVSHNKFSGDYITLELTELIYWPLLEKLQPENGDEITNEQKDRSNSRASNQTHAIAENNLQDLGWKLKYSRGNCSSFLKKQREWRKFRIN